MVKVEGLFQPLWLRIYENGWNVGCRYGRTWMTVLLRLVLIWHTPVCVCSCCAELPMYAVLTFAVCLWWYILLSDVDTRLISEWLELVVFYVCFVQESFVYFICCWSSRLSRNYTRPAYECIFTLCSLSWFLLHSLTFPTILQSAVN